MARLAAALVVVVVGLVAFSAPFPPASAPCPEATHADPSRLQRLVRLLAASRQGADLLRRVGHAPRTCFGRVDEGIVRSDGVVVLPVAQQDEAAAARLGHLLVHQLDAFAFEEGRGGRSCAERVAAAMVAEARGHALELRLRRQLGVAAGLLPTEVESAFWAASEAEGIEVLRLHLARSGPGSLADAYARRCRD